MRIKTQDGYSIEASVSINGEDIEEAGDYIEVITYKSDYKCGDRVRVVDEPWERIAGKNLPVPAGTTGTVSMRDQRYDFVVDFDNGVSASMHAAWIEPIDHG